MPIIGLDQPPNITNDAVRQPAIKTRLDSMLRSCGIASLQDITNYVEKHHGDSATEQLDISLPSMDGRFRVVTDATLAFDLDSEHRLFVEHIVGRDTILHVNGMRLRNSISVDFTNCVFTGNLYISISEMTLSKVYLDSCLILGKLIINGVDSDHCSVMVSQVNCFEMDIKGIHVKSLHISQCKIPVLYLQDSSANDVYIKGNDIAYARVCRNRFTTAEIEHEQFNLQRMGREAPVIADPQHAPKGFFERITNFMPGDTARQELFETMAFLRKHTALESDRRALNTVRLVESSQYQNSFFARMTVAMIGGVQRPFYILLIALGILFLFAFIYRYASLEFAIASHPKINSLDMYEACYFSGVTILTVGYGDIVPLAKAQFWAVIEGFLGVTLWGLFVVALVRRYID